MTEKLKMLTKNFQSQQDQVFKDIDNTRAKLENLLSVREQLKGALFALQALDTPALDTPAAAPKDAAAPVEVPKEVTEHKAEEKEEG